MPAIVSNGFLSNNFVSAASLMGYITLSSFQEHWFSQVGAVYGSVSLHNQRHLTHLPGSRILPYAVSASLGTRTIAQASVHP